MTNKPLISIIVPIFKVEEYINRCVDSMLNQTYTNLEIILVDDGSPDNCGSICEKYKEKDSRVATIHKENGGLSDARNVAIDIAKGEYITFIDGDDWVSNYYVENLYNAINKDNAEMAISCFEEVFDARGASIPSNQLKNYELLNSVECLKRLLYQQGIETCAWGKLYKKELFNELRYPVGKLYEDTFVTYKAIEKCLKIAYIKNVDYYYFQRATSIQNKKFNANKLDGVIGCGTMMKDVSNDYPELRKAAICRYFSTTSNIFFQINDKEFNVEKQTLWQELIKYRKTVLFDKDARKKARLGALASYGGMKFMEFCYRKTQWRGKEIIK